MVHAELESKSANSPRTPFTACGLATSAIDNGPEGQMTSLKSIQNNYLLMGAKQRVHLTVYEYSIKSRFTVVCTAIKLCGPSGCRVTNQSCAARRSSFAPSHSEAILFTGTR